MQILLRLIIFIFMIIGFLYLFNLSIHLSINHLLILMSFHHFLLKKITNYNRIYGSLFFIVPSYTSPLHLSLGLLLLMEFFELEFYFELIFSIILSHFFVFVNFVINYIFILVIFHNLILDEIKSD
jgi:hypothetical protein